MTLPYTPNVPQGTQQINQTQDPIEVNFQSISDFVEVNHVGFNQTLEGRHTFVSYIQQATDPSTSANEMALYSKVVSGDTNLMEMFYRYPSNGSVVQLTGLNNYSTGTGGGSFAGHSGATGSIIDSWSNGFWQYMSNGVLVMVWTPSNYFASSFTAGSAIPVPIPHGYGAPTFTQTPFNVQFVILFGQSTNINSGIVAANATSTTQMNLYSAITSSSGQTVPMGSFMAIGV